MIGTAPSDGGPDPADTNVASAGRISRSGALSVDDFRRLAMSLPGAEEHDHWGRPSFRVRGRIFATLWPDDERGVVKVSRDEMAALAEADPATYTARPWGASSWLEVSLTRAEPGEVSELVVEAWRSVAPRRLVAAHEGRRQRGAAETP